MPIDGFIVRIQKHSVLNGLMEYIKTNFQYHKCKRINFPVFKTFVRVGMEVFLPFHEN